MHNEFHLLNKYEAVMKPYNLHFTWHLSIKSVIFFKHESAHNFMLFFCCDTIWDYVHFNSNGNIPHKNNNKKNKPYIMQAGMHGP